MGKKIFRMKSICALVISVCMAHSGTSLAEEYFNPAFLEMDDAAPGGVSDLSVFERAESQTPGAYLVDISVNNEAMTAYPRNILFSKNADGKLEACITAEELGLWGVRTKSYPKLSSGEGQCADISAIPGAFTDFQFNRQRLNFSIPQIAMNTPSLDAVPPELWDEGIPAFLMNYSANSYQSRIRGIDSYNSTYLNLRPGLNIGPWRLRNYTTWQRSNHGMNKWDTVYSYIQRNIVALESQMIVGDSTAPSDVYDSVPFRGFQLSSDDDMLPSSIRNYAPVVRGVARSEAHVIVRQNGYVVYDTTVAPGAFEITDLASTGGSGDLDVTVKEADGSEQHMIIPYASLPVLQREGRFRYSLTGGQYRSYDSRTEKNTFLQGTSIYGLPWGVTLYGGLQNAGDKYQSYALGVGKNIGAWGAFSADVIHSISTPENDHKQQGQSYRIRYSKNFQQTGTNFTIAGYRYSTDGFHSLEETLGTYRSSGDIPGYISERRRNRAELMVSQDLGQTLGAFNLSLVREDFWDKTRRSLSANVGYYKNIGDVGLNINYSWNRNTELYGFAATDKVFALELTVPLDSLFGRTYASYGSTHTSGVGTRHHLGINGSSLKDYSLNWGINAAHNENNDQAVGGNISWKSGFGTLNGSYNHSRDSQQYSYGVVGGMVIHEHGITLSQQLGETIGLVNVPDVEDVRVANYPGISTDSRGYAVVPYLNPYKRNDLRIDSQTLKEDAEIAYMSEKVIPTRGAIVRAEYKTAVGHRVLLNLRQQNGSPVPFGAIATLVREKGTADTENPSIVGEEGEVFMAGMPDKGIIHVQWNNGHEQFCEAEFTANKADDLSGLWMAESVCK
nr:fimbrial biogenesis outer membrane usher protein [Citrobacter farmeri]